ncbi:hypothetical protein EI94DRAFT_1701537 [Lactarius quietus]|nr:hypothetical protein EI94DRAFT_1701537 [Lactarius quietus]
MCWASTDNWQPGFIILGANVNAIPTPPPLSPVIIGTDGFWGAHKWTVYPQPHHPEFPYLTWIALCQPNTSLPSIVHTPVDKSMWQTHPDQPNLHLISPTLLEGLTKEWESVKAVVQGSFEAVSSDPSSSVRHLMEVYIRALSALTHLDKDFGACCFWSSAHFWTGGGMFALVTNFNLPSMHQHGVPFLKMFGYMKIMHAEVVLSPHTLCKSSQHKLETMEYRGNDEAGWRAKMAKTCMASLASSSNNQELRCLTNAGAVPDWFLGIQEVWSV